MSDLLRRSYWSFWVQQEIALWRQDYLRRMCMSDETGERDDSEQKAEAEFLSGTAHKEDRSRDTWQAWYDSPEEKRKRGER